MKENWFVLALAAYHTMLPEQAFEYYEKLEMRQKNYTSREEIEDIQAMRDAGMKWDEIGEIYGVDKCTVWRRLNRGKRREPAKCI